MNKKVQNVMFTHAKQNQMQNFCFCDYNFWVAYVLSPHMQQQSTLTFKKIVLFSHVQISPITMPLVRLLIPTKNGFIKGN
jgi:hypothetical protein